MKDRLSKYPGRVKLTPVAGQANTFDMIRADEPENEGTPLNKNTFLTDETAVELGLDPADDPTPNDALKKIKGKYEPKVGDVLETLRTDLGEEWLLCNGEVLPRDEYPALRGLLQNDLSWRRISELPDRTSSFTDVIPLVNGCWVFLNYSNYKVGYLYDPNANVLKTITMPEFADDVSYYGIRGFTHDGGQYIMVAGYNVSGSTGKDIHIFTSNDAETWTEVFVFDREAAFELRDAYFDGQRILLGSYRTEYLNSKNYYYNKVFVLDLEQKTVTALTDGTITHTNSWFGFEECPPGYWRTREGYYTEGTSSTQIQEGYCMYKSGETTPCFTYGGYGNMLVFFNSRFCLTIGGSRSSGTSNTAYARTMLMDLKTGEQTVLPWSMMVGNYGDCTCYGAYYNDKTNEWRFMIFYDADTDVYYDLYISADSDPKDIMAWRAEKTSLTSRETNYPRWQMGFDRSMINETSGTYKYYDLYNSVSRFLPTHDGETYKYIYAYGEVDDVMPDEPSCDDDVDIPGYERLLCLENTGTAYINTEFVPNGNTSIFTKIKSSKSASNCYIFGAKGNSTSYYCYYGYSQWTKYYNNGQQSISSTDAYTTEPYILCFRKNNMYVNGYTTGSASATFDLTGFPMYLFAYNNDGTAKVGTCTYYYCKIYDNETLVRDFIPVRRLSDGAVGLWDKVTEEFYGNAGTGEFVAHEMEENE